MGPAQPRGNFHNPSLFHGLGAAAVLPLPHIKKTRPPTPAAWVRIAVSYIERLRRSTPTRPTSPEPSSKKLDGSGVTTTAKFTGSPARPLKVEGLRVKMTVSA